MALSDEPVAILCRGRRSYARQLLRGRWYCIYCGNRVQVVDVAFDDRSGRQHSDVTSDGQVAGDQGAHPRARRRL